MAFHESMSIYATSFVQNETQHLKLSRGVQIVWANIASACEQDYINYVTVVASP